MLHLQLTTGIQPRKYLLLFHLSATSASKKRGNSLSNLDLSSSAAATIAAEFSTLFTSTRFVFKPEKLHWSLMAYEGGWRLAADATGNSLLKLFSSKVLLHYEFPLQTLNNFPGNLWKKAARRRHKISVARDAFLEDADGCSRCWCTCHKPFHWFVVVLPAE